MRYVKLFFIIALLGSITSCSYLYGDRGVIKDRNNDYLKAQSIAPLNIPPGYASSSIHSTYPVSDRNDPDMTKKVDLTPPELNSPGK